MCTYTLQQNAIVLEKIVPYNELLSSAYMKNLVEKRLVSGAVQICKQHMQVLVVFLNDTTGAAATINILRTRANAKQDSVVKYNSGLDGCDNFTARDTLYPIPQSVIGLILTHIY